MKALLLFKIFVTRLACLKVAFQFGLFTLGEFLVKEQHDSILIFLTFRDCHKIKYRNLGFQTALK
jgi:hypothetical protein